MSESGQNGHTRRTVVRTGTAATATVLAPSFVQVASGATDSGEVELTTTSTQPSGTNIEIRIYEDLDGDGTAENQQKKEIPAGTGVTTVYAALDGAEGSGNVYWMDVLLSTSDDTQTPELDVATITLPEEQAQTQTPLPDREKQSPFQIWDNFLVFVSFMTLTAASVAGLGSRSMAVGALAAYSVFAYIAVETGHTLLTNILYLSVVLIVVGMAFKLWRLEFGGDI